YYQAPLDAAAASFAIKLAANAVDSPRDLESAVSALERDRGDSLIVIPDSFNIVHREQIIALTARYRIPPIYPYRFAAREGACISYGTDQADLFRRAQIYTNRTLKGKKPADPPVQTPTKFESAINLKTANALGLPVPPSLLATADEVIE